MQTSEQSCWLPSDQKVLSWLQQFKSGYTKRTTQLLLSLTKEQKVMLAGIEILAHFPTLLFNIEVALFFSIKVTYVIYKNSF